MTKLVPGKLYKLIHVRQDDPGCAINKDNSLVYITPENNKLLYMGLAKDMVLLHEFLIGDQIIAFDLSVNGSINENRSDKYFAQIGS